MAERTLIDVASADDLLPGEPVLVEIEGTPVVLVKVDGDVLAVHDVCTHALESLSGGWVDEDRIECPRHGCLLAALGRGADPAGHPAAADVRRRGARRPRAGRSDPEP